MQLYGALILFLSFSAAYGLKCYSCLPTDPNSCTDIITCPEVADRCSSLKIGGQVAKSCRTRAKCIGPMSCCEGDLCNGAVPTGNGAVPTGNGAVPTGNGAVPTGNGAVPTGPGVTLLLLSSALMMLFV